MGAGIGLNLVWHIITAHNGTIRVESEPGHGARFKIELPIPIIMVTAKSQVEDRIHGLDIGADDYVVKPFSTEELLARVRSVLRRYTRPTESIDRVTLGSTEIDFEQQKAWRSGKPVHLTRKEFAMLHLLTESRGEVVSRERFLDVAWGYTAFPSTRTVDNHIASLRVNIEPDPENPRWLRTVHGGGYRLETEPGSNSNLNRSPDDKK